MIITRPFPPAAGTTSRHWSARGWPAYRQQAEPSGCCAGRPCRHDGHSLRFPGLFDRFQLWERLFEDMTIEEDESLQRDILGGSRHLSPHGEMREKGADFWGTHVRRVALMMERIKRLAMAHTPLPL
jgi:hypothetical protein